jgi:hypothetical protein
VLAPEQINTLFRGDIEQFGFACDDMAAGSGGNCAELIHIW